MHTVANGALLGRIVHLVPFATLERIFENVQTTNELSIQDDLRESCEGRGREKKAFRH